MSVDPPLPRAWLPTFPICRLAFVFGAKGHPVENLGEQISRTDYRGPVKHKDYLIEGHSIAAT